MEKSIYFVIPARKGSKGFPLKNRKLLGYTIKEIPRKIHQKTIISTDDKEIIKKVSNTQIKIIKRDPKLCGDKVSVRDVMKDVVKKCGLKNSDVIVMLYLTYLGRKFQEIKNSNNFIVQENLLTEVLYSCRNINVPTESKTSFYAFFIEKSPRKSKKTSKWPEIPQNLDVVKLI